MICPECGNVERFLQRVVEVRTYPFDAPPSLQCKSAWSDEWEGEVEWLGSDFEETLEVLGIFCRDCGLLVVSNGN
jgi:hypothetical protein